MPAQRGILAAVLVVSSLVGATAAAAAGMALLQARPSWVMFGFESVVLTAAVIGFLIGRGRYADGRAIGLLCVAGTFLVGSIFGYIGGGRMLFGVDLKPLLAFRGLAAAALVASAAWTVLSQNPRATLPPFIRGSLFGIAVPVILIIVWKFRGSLASLPDMVQVAIAMVVFGLVTGLLAATVQLLVKAFDAGIRHAESAMAAPFGSATRSL